MTELQKVFMRNLRLERNRAGLTQEQTAEKVGLAHKYYGSLELGYRFPSVQTIERLARAFGIAPYRLFMEREEASLPTSEVIRRYNRVLEVKHKKMLSEARAGFLKK